MRQRTRLVAKATVAAVMCTMVGATIAAASPSAAPSSTAASSSSATAGDKAPGKGGGGIDNAQLAKVAASLHVSVQRLTTALGNLKKAFGQGTSKVDAVAAFAKELGVSVKQAEAALGELGGGKVKQPGSGVPAEAVHLLAGELHISVDRARQVFTDIEKLQPRSRDITADPGFIRIARGLGITPQQLVTALIDVKEKLAGSAPKAPPKTAPSPTK
jgi:hypothetical protein